MPEAFYLSEQDVAILKRLLQDANSRPPQRPNRPTGVTWDEGQVAPEVYVALTPVGGITGLQEDPFDTGTAFGAGDIPGSAVCDIFKLVKISNIPTLVRTQVEKRVYNLSSEAIEGDQWVLITRDKFGQWYVTGNIPQPFTSRGGPCSNGLASLRYSDCVIALGPNDQEIELAYDLGLGVWTSNVTMTYPDDAYGSTFGEGIVKFWYENGYLFASVAVDGVDKPLLVCGNGCFQGGPLTGHGLSTSGVACSGSTFEICFECGNCTEDTGTGTSTSTSTGTGDVLVGGCTFPRTMYATAYAGSGNCACASATGAIEFDEGTEHWTGTVTLNSCPGTPTFFVDVYHTGVFPFGQWHMDITGCTGTLGITMNDSDFACTPTNMVLATAPPDTCCGSDPMDVFFIRLSS